MKYIKRFANREEYEDFIQSEGFEYPVVSCIASTDTLYLKKHHPNRNLVDEEGLRAIGWDDDDILTLMNHVWWTEEEVDNWKVEPETIELYKTKKTLTNFSVVTQKDNPVYFYAKFFPKITFTSVPTAFARMQTYAFPSLIWTSTTKPASNFYFQYMQNLKYVILSKIYTGVDLTNVPLLRFATNWYNIEYIDLRNVVFGGNTNFASMFDGCNTLKKIDGIENLITSSYTGSLGGMFRGCYVLEELNIENWDTSNVTSLAYLFNNCISIKELDLTNWNVSNVTDFGGVFNGLRAKKLNISGWDFSSATSLTNICASISVDEIYMNNVNTSTITNMTNMFQGIGYVKKLYGADFDCSSCASGSYANFFSNQLMLQELYDSQGTQTSAFNGMKYSFSLVQSYGLSHDSIVAILNGLATVTTAQTLTLGNTNLNKLTDEEKAIATNKGWTLA